VTSVIIGARRLAQLEDNLKSIDLALTADRDDRTRSRSAQRRKGVSGVDGRAAVGPQSGPAAGKLNPRSGGGRRAGGVDFGRL